MMTAFIKKYDGKVMEDAGSYVSKEFSNFQNAMKREIKRLAEEIGAKLVDFSKGHYDMDWFIERNGKYVNGHYSKIYPRSEADLTSNTVCYVRTADGPKDYRGGTNHHCAFENIQEEMNKLLN